MDLNSLSPYKVQENNPLDYSDASLYEDNPLLKLNKESYTPEELRSMLISDLNLMMREEPPHKNR